MRRAWSTGTVVMLAIGTLAFAARLVPVLRGGGLHGVLAYDDGVYFSAAESFVFGRMPYRDFLLLHPPGIILALAPFGWLARLTTDDTGLAMARLAFMGVGALNAVLVYRVARVQLGQLAAVTAGAFYALWGPSVYAERTTLLEPMVNLGLLAGLLLLGDPRTTSRRRLVLAGVALGLATAVKLWAAVPFLILLGWILLRRRRAAVPFTAGAVVAATVVCLPFFTAAPGRMFRFVVLDQIGRNDNAVGLRERLGNITDAVSVHPVLPGDVLQLTVLLSIATVVGTILVARLCPPARIWCVLLVTQGALLLTVPYYFTHYATYVAPALALVVGATTALVLAGVRVRAPHLRPAAIAALALGALALLAVTDLRVEGRAGPSHAARAMVSAARCVAADTPAVLVSADLLGRDLRNNCAVLVDPTGMTYDQDSGDLPAGRTVAARRADTEWQGSMQRWFARNEAVIVQHRNPAGLSQSTLDRLARDAELTRHRRYTVYVAR